MLLSSSQAPGELSLVEEQFELDKKNSSVSWSKNNLSSIKRTPLFHETGRGMLVEASHG